MIYVSKYLNCSVRFFTYMNLLEDKLLTLMPNKTLYMQLPKKILIFYLDTKSIGCCKELINCIFAFIKTRHLQNYTNKLHNLQSMCGSDMLYTFPTDRLAHFINTCFNQHRLPMLEVGRM